MLGRVLWGQRDDRAVRRRNVLRCRGEVDALRRRGARPVLSVGVGKGLVAVELRQWREIHECRKGQRAVMKGGSIAMRGGAGRGRRGELVTLVFRH